MQTDTIGDTVVVRTRSGGVWPRRAELVPEVTIGVFEGPDEYMFGQITALAVAPDGSIYVFDRNLSALRKYAPDGRYLTSLGRRGEGPGEFGNADGLAVLPDGRALLRDPNNSRITIYSAQGDALDTWPIDGSWSTSRRPYVDTAGNVYTEVLLNQGADIADWARGLAKYSPDGVLLDSLPAPDWGHEPAELVARYQSGDGFASSSTSVPFAPNVSWSFSRLGYFVGGIGDRYAVDLLRVSEPTLRIEREVGPVPVHREEKAEQERLTTWSMRRTDPDWRWDGPPVPDVKPSFSSVDVGDDGRIWVQVPQPSERVPDDPATGEAGNRADGRPPARWREPTVAYDIFEPDGRYLGQVHVPSMLRLHVMRGDRIWAVVLDEYDVPSVVRYRLDAGQPSGS